MPILGAAVIATIPIVGAQGAAAASTKLPSSITVWTYYGSAPYFKYEAQAAALFNAHFPTVKVDYLNVPTTVLDGKVLAAAATHNGPDVLVDNPNVDWPELSSAGALGNMSPYISQLGTPFPFPSSVVFTYKGKVETIQNYLNFVDLWYNKTILNKLGLPVPATETQFVTDMAAATKAGYTGFLMNTDPGSDAIWQFMPWMTNRGLNYCSLTSPSSEKTVAAALSDLRSWLQAGYLPKDSDTLNQGTTLPLFLAGKTLFMENGNWNISSMTGLKFQVSDTPMPAATAPSRVLLGGEGQAIGGYTHYPQIAFDYLKYGWFSDQAEKNVLADFGSFATRTDLTKYVSALPYDRGFAQQESHGLAPYPDNPKVSKIAEDMGNLISGFSAGSGTPLSTAQQMVTTMKADVAAGGGECTPGLRF
jgi:ABC-type glycerol-3-phosphate transport system substrate-binding protein